MTDERPEQPDTPQRRQFLKHTLLSTLGLGLLGGALHTLKNASQSYAPPDRARRGLIRPPGSLAENDFLSQCIRCQRCSEICESRAIRLFGAGTGVHEATPYIVPETRACTLCLKCGEVCPTGAIAKLTDKSEASMGEAVVDERLCVSHDNTGICGACFTMCPLRGKAIKQGLHNRPYVNADVCVGCGLCEEVHHHSYGS